MATIESDNSRNEVQIDLDKYMKLVDKLDAAEDLIEKMKEDRARMKPGKRKFMLKGKRRKPVPCLCIFLLSQRVTLCAGVSQGHLRVREIVWCSSSLVCVV
jgi:hypothetical protein